MEDLKGKLEAIRDMARSRVRMLNEEGTFYEDTQKTFYLQEYESRLRELDRLLDNLTCKPAGSPHDDKPDPAPPLKRYWRRLFEGSRQH